MVEVTPKVIPVPRCPKCDYALTLLKKRDKYKCALCDKLYEVRAIDLIQFRKWNKAQREKDKQEVGIKPKILSKKVQEQHSKQEKQKRLDSWD